MAAAAAASSFIPSSLCQPKAYRLRLPPRPSIKAFSAPILTPDDLKRLAADKAVDYVKSGMVLGLGTGSTAAFVVDKLGALLKSGALTGIVGVPTSRRTEEQAAALGIPLATLATHPRLDLAIDGADEVDPNLDLVKGRGGALLREKMVEAASDAFVVVADDSKLVSGLGGSGLAMPVEVVQFCWNYNLVRLQDLFKEEGCEAKLRLAGDGRPYVTDNSNYIVDLYFRTPIRDSTAAGKEIAALEGVVEHGLFLDMATAVIIAGKDGVTVKRSGFGSSSANYVFSTSTKPLPYSLDSILCCHRCFPYAYPPLWPNGQITLANSPHSTLTAGAQGDYMIANTTVVPLKSQQPRALFGNDQHHGALSVQDPCLILCSATIGAVL